MNWSEMEGQLSEGWPVGRPPRLPPLCELPRALAPGFLLGRLVPFCVDEPAKGQSSGFFGGGGPPPVGVEFCRDMVAAGGCGVVVVVSSVVVVGGKKGELNFCDSSGVPIFHVNGMFPERKFSTSLSLPSTFSPRLTPGDLRSGILGPLLGRVVVAPR